MPNCLRITFAAVLLAAAFLPGSSGHAHAAGARLDRHPVSAADLTGFQQKKGAQKNSESPPASGGPAVLVDWYQAREYCAARGKRLPSAQEWIAACQAREIEFPSWIWEWTSTDAEGSEAGFKQLCGPGTSTCGCTHAYHPTWSNAVKGFRCAIPLPSVQRMKNMERR
ncbi:MAG: SUMF1/EgtB/PvdO family nonheme iron enzyme [bacterium]